MAEPPMQVAPLDADQAWGIVLATRDPGRGRPRSWPLNIPVPDGSGSIRLHEDASWDCDRILSPEAREILDLYLPLCVDTGRPYVFAQMGQSLDGRIATLNGDSHYVSGPAGIVHLHRLRALADAVVIGAGTAIADDPRLTVRRTTGRNPVRVIVDTNGRVPEDRTAFHDGQASTLILRAPGKAGVAPGQAQPLTVERSGDGVAPGRVLELLAARGLRRVLIEGGGITVSRFLDAGLVDRLHVTVSPMIIGSGRPAFTLPPIHHLDGALRPRTRRFMFAGDVLFDLDIRRSAE